MHWKVLKRARLNSGQEPQETLAVTRSGVRSPSAPPIASNKLGHPNRMPFVVSGLPLGAKGVDFHAHAKIEHLAVIA